MKLKTMLAAAAMVTALDSQAALIHQYELNGNLTDTLGGPSLVSAGGALTFEHYVLADNKGLRLPFALNSVYTLDMSFQFSAVDGKKRIVDFFDARDADYGLYSEHRSGNLATVRLYPNTHTGGGIFADRPTRLTLTRDASSNFKIYVNGQLSASIIDVEGYANPGAHLISLFQDNVAGSESPTGWVDFIRVYDTALAGGQVYMLPGAVPGDPNAPVDLPEPGSVALLLGGMGALGVLRRRRSA